MAARAASTASSGSDLPWLRRVWRLGRLTSTTSTPFRRRNRARPDPIGTGALDADLGHLAELLEPGQQRLVAGGIGIERLGADQRPSGSRAAATCVSRWVSTPPVIPGAASTMVMAIPSFLSG